MPGTAGIETYRTTSALPAEALRLMDHAPGVFAGRDWWDVVVAHAIPLGAEPLFLVARQAGKVAAVVPLLRQDGRLGGLATPYTCEYRPLFADGADPIAAMTALGRFCRWSGVARFDAMADEWPEVAALRAGATRAGLRCLRFAHFGNWSEDVSGQDWATYLRGRPGALRETIRRRMRKAETQAEASFELMTRPEEMDRAVTMFESVYARSWKEAEPFPAFNAALMRALAVAGRLRFGAWLLAGEPVAVQIWAVKDGHATVLKLAHDEAFKPHSPGTVLTALMVRHLLDRERVGRIDFGRGDDAYKQGWATERRQRIGILLVNPWHPVGLAAWLRHLGGHWLRRDRTQS